MNTKAVKSFGLALMLAAGVLAVLLALGTFSPQKVAAQVAALSVTPATATGGAVYSPRVSFGLGDDSYVQGQSISVTFTGFTVPSSIDTSSVIIRSGDSTGRPGSISVSDSTITVTVGVDGNGVGMILEGTANDIIFTSGAGIKAPVAAGTYNVSIGAQVDTVLVSRAVRLSPKSGDSSAKISVSGTSFTDGTARVYVNQLTNEIAAREEPASTTAVAVVTVSNGAFTTTVSATTAKGFANGANNIDVFDAAGGKATAAFSRTGKVKVTPSTLVKGAKGILVDLTEGPDDDSSITGVTIGGIAVPFGDAGDDTLTNGGGYNTGADTPETTADPSNYVDGAANLIINVPTILATGSRTLVLTDSSLAAGSTTVGSAKVTVKALDLTVSPDSAVQGMTVTVRGSGFDKSGENAGLDTLLVGTQPIDVTGLQRTPSSAGEFFITFTVPDLAPGPMTVSLTQLSGKVGEGKLTISKPTVTFEPASSRLGTPISVTGTGFPANDFIDIKYGADRVGVVSSDVGGGWTANITVPTTADPGAKAVISAVRPAGSRGIARGSDDSAATGPKHTVPAAGIVLSANEAVSGQKVTITGTGFKPYSTGSVQIGTITVTSAINTGTTGDFEIEVLVPLLPPGNSSLTVTAGDVPTIRENFKILSTPPAPVSRAVDVVFADLIEDGVLGNVFRYNNADKSWQGYNPAAPDLSDLEEVEQFNSLWVEVSEDAEWQDQALSAGWNNVTVRR